MTVMMTEVGSVPSMEPVQGLKLMTLRTRPELNQPDTPSLVFMIFITV